MLVRSQERFMCVWGALVVMTACNQPNPPEGSEEAGTDGSTADYYPLVDGATWTYRHKRLDMTMVDEIVEMKAIEHDGKPAFELKDNEDERGETTVSILVDVDGQVLRVHKEVLAMGALVVVTEYDPGFLRFDAGWNEKGQMTNWQYDRTEYNGMGDLIVPTEARLQIFTIEELSVAVTVEAGTFDCMQVLRDRPNLGEATRFWFAAGVGKIKDEDLVTGTVEELVDYDVPKL